MLDKPMELCCGPAPRLHWDKDWAMACWRPRDGGSCSCDTPGIPAVAQRVSLAWNEQRLSPMAAAAAAADGNWGRPWWVGRSVPGARKTLVVFLRFFHLARRFWNQTCRRRRRFNICWCSDRPESWEHRKRWVKQWCAWFFLEPDGFYLQISISKCLKLTQNHYEQRTFSLWWNKSHISPPLKSFFMSEWILNMNKLIPA